MNNKCKPICRLCRNLVISTAVAFDAGTNTLNITIPDGTYYNGQKVCIVIAQTIPTTTTINALVNIITNGGTFPLTKCNCVQVTACEIRTRTRYSTCVSTNTVSGVFRLLGKVCCLGAETLDSLPVVSTPAVANVVADPVVAFSMPKVVAKKEAKTNE